MEGRKERIEREGSRGGSNVCTPQLLDTLTKEKDVVNNRKV